ncbi:metal-dependent hydrolase [Alkalibacterium olivapovliticus]|uniref:Inner membrane protein n=1 Tax=Alkalibacterium olivapovliticus TaxID=99907 RepID=A0A2T0W2W3_9LACT|nr:metal-dependent hydrolase [Alkalibacterium olivapovliticus]PRY79347.1 inner membrane protein [Alkalibacterium olivapovliticus]
MRYHTHLMVTYAAAMPVLVSTGQLTVGTAVALGIGAVFPDIDHPKSFIGNRTGGISHGIGMVFGHRGLAHSLAGAAVVLFLTGLLVSALNLPTIWGDYFIIGYIAHLIEDSFSKTGVAWFQPIYSKRIQFGFRKVYYTTGKFSETIIFLIAFCGLMYQISLLF